MWWLKTTDIHSLTVLEVETQNPGVGGVGPSWRLWGGVCSLRVSLVTEGSVSVRGGQRRHCDHLLPLHLAYLLIVSASQISLSSLWQGHQHLDSGPTLSPGGSHLEILNRITTANPISFYPSCRWGCIDKTWVLGHRLARSWVFCCPFISRGSEATYPVSLATWAFHLFVSLDRDSSILFIYF